MSSRQGYSRDSSCDSAVSATSKNESKSTIHARRAMSRANNSSPAPSPPSLNGFAELFHSRVSTPFVTPIASDEADLGDMKRWQRMLRMQREFHCYRSARLEAAVEALERGENPPVPSKLCLDLLNEELKSQLQTARVAH